ncbi:hypothetical protein E8D34_07310 [Nocardioides sp. GY 10113]|uniref:hypothetical protein n=1 Tax=Nocardioides sp. GY 10113 TaxID=2569761 RepID=UPI0010A7BAA7|nr:hypothetical protein [Nocardioides sp. GY 10113]TIC88085.1 hypothetical protein E8D34_07310 [Nocardioides sp. GY 10113]
MPLRTGTKIKWGTVTVGGTTAAQTPRMGEADSGGQQASVLLQMNVAGYVQAVDANDTDSANEYYVVADLAAGSTFSPGQMGGNTRECRGYYTHSVDTRLWFDDGAYAVDTETPQPSSAGGSGSSSTSSSTTVGFFGHQLTASESWSASQSASRGYQDFETESHTSHKSNLGGSEVVHQRFPLRLSNAGPYVNPFSLVGSDQYLAGLPPRAAGNLPLVTAASFKALAPQKQYPRTARLHVSVTVWMAKVIWWSNAPAHWFKNPVGQKVQLVGEGTALVRPGDYDLTRGPGDYPMQTLGVVTGSYIALPWSHEFSWAFDVDFAKGRVTPA